MRTRTRRGNAIVEVNPKFYLDDKSYALAKRLGARYRNSRRGVPHILYATHGVVYSICYFRNHDTWRVFFPYPSAEQTRVDFCSEDEVVSFLEAR